MHYNGHNKHIYIFTRTPDIQAHFTGSYILDRENVQDPSSTPSSVSHTHTHTHMHTHTHREEMYLFIRAGLQDIDICSMYYTPCFTYVHTHIHNITHTHTHTHTQPHSQHHHSAQQDHINSQKDAPSARCSSTYTYTHTHTHISRNKK